MKLIKFALVIAGICYALTFIPKPQLAQTYSMNAQASSTIAEILENN